VDLNLLKKGTKEMVESWSSHGAACPGLGVDRFGFLRTSEAGRHLPPNLRRFIFRSELQVVACNVTTMLLNSLLEGIEVVNHFLQVSVCVAVSSLTHTLLGSLVVITAGKGSQPPTSLARKISFKNSCL
jgi:hypothetical protein